MKSSNNSAKFAGPALALCLGLTAACAAQQPSEVASTATTPSGPSLTVRDQKALESFEPPINEEYTLGAGDEITLDVPGHTELAGKLTVGPDGMITMPIIGNVHVADLTREAAAKTLADKLDSYYNEVSVTVGIDKYSANKVRVLGYVQHPGEIIFEDTPTLLDAIGRAGLLSPTVSPNGIATNIGPGIPETCTIYRGNDTAVQVQLRQLLVSGSVLADMRLRRNDIVYVPQPKELFVSVLGQVSKPGTIPLTPESTLTSILAQAGCCTDNGGFNPKIHIIDPSTQKDFSVNYKDVMTLAGQQEFTLHSGDVIIVPITGWSKFTTIVQKISPVATMVSLATIVGAG